MMRHLGCLLLVLPLATPAPAVTAQDRYWKDVDGLMSTLRKAPDVCKEPAKQKDATDKAIEKLIKTLGLTADRQAPKMDTPSEQARLTAIQIHALDLIIARLEGGEACCPNCYYQRAVDFSRTREQLEENLALTFEGLTPADQRATCPYIPGRVIRTRLTGFCAG